MKKKVVAMFLPDAHIIFKERREYTGFNVTVKSDVLKFSETEIDQMAKIIKMRLNSPNMKDLETEVGEEIIQAFGHRRKPIAVMAMKDGNNWEIRIGENILAM